MWWKWYLAGLATMPAFYCAAYVGRAAFWSWADTRYAFQHAELKPGRSKWNWLWIGPKLAWRTFWRTLWSDMNGLRRTG